MNTCEFIKADGLQCRANALKDENFCFFHSPKQEHARKEAIMKGGKSLKRSYGRSDQVELKTAQDVVCLLEQTINDLRQNKTSSKTANTIAFIAGVAMKAFILNAQDNNDKKVADFMRF